MGPYGYPGLARVPASFCACGGVGGAPVQAQVPDLAGGGDEAFSLRLLFSSGGSLLDWDPHLAEEVVHLLSKAASSAGSGGGGGGGRALLLLLRSSEEG